MTIGKLHGETFLQAAHQIGVKSDQCVVFQDTGIGVNAAQNAGMDCFLRHDAGFTLNR